MGIPVKKRSTHANPPASSLTTDTPRKLTFAPEILLNLRAYLELSNCAIASSKYCTNAFVSAKAKSRRKVLHFFHVACLLAARWLHVLLENQHAITAFPPASLASTVPTTCPDLAVDFEGLLGNIPFPCARVVRIFQRLKFFRIGANCCSVLHLLLTSGAPGSQGARSAQLSRLLLKLI